MSRAGAATYSQNTNVPPGLSARLTSATTCRASTKPIQKRTGPASAPSHDNQEVTPGGLAAAQFDNSTLLPAPAPPNDCQALASPAVSRLCSIDLVTSAAGSVVGRNFVSANRGLWRRHAQPSRL
jgi:hypothetical protein